MSLNICRNCTTFSTSCSAIPNKFSPCKLGQEPAMTLQLDKQHLLWFKLSRLGLGHARCLESHPLFLVTQHYWHSQME